MVVLRDLVQHSGLQHIKQAEKVLDLSAIKGLLWDDRLQVL